MSGRNRIDSGTSLRPSWRKSDNSRKLKSSVALPLIQWYLLKNIYKNYDTEKDIKFFSKLISDSGRFMLFREMLIRIRRCVFTVFIGNIKKYKK